MPIFIFAAQCCSSAYSDIIFMRLACFFIKILPGFSDNYHLLYQSKFCSHLLEKRLAKHLCWACVFFASCSNLFFLSFIYMCQIVTSSWINVQISYSNEAKKLMKKVASLMKCHKRKSLLRQHHVTNGTSNVDRTLFKLFLRWWGSWHYVDSTSYSHVATTSESVDKSTSHWRKTLRCQKLRVTMCQRRGHMKLFAGLLRKASKLPISLE